MTMSGTPRVYGATLVKQAIVDLATLDVEGLTLGTRCYVIAAGADFRLAVSTATVDHVAVEAVAGYTGLRWLLVVTTQPLLPPAGTLLWDMNPSNLDGLNNSGFVDGQALASVVNTGSLGASGNWTRSTPGGIFYKAVGDASVFPSPTVRSDGTGRLLTGNVTPLSQPTTIAMVAKNDGTGTQTYFSGNDGSNINQMYLNGGILLSFYAVGGTDAGSFIPTANKYNVFIVTFNGGSSLLEANEANRPLGGSPGTSFLDGLSLFADSGGTSPMTGEIARTLVYLGNPGHVVLAQFFSQLYAPGWPK